jgi:predicted lipoprotein with Yx(FWY)xxD motif
MKRSLPIGAVLVAALAVAALGGSSTAATNSPVASVSASRAKVELSNTKLGKVLADGSGRTLYLFEKDKGPKSSCSGACATAWPPLTTTGTPKAGAGVKASKLKTTSRGGGVKQVTYNGHPLYRFVKDTAPRQTKGQNVHAFGADWYVVSAAGRKIDQGGS